MHQDLFTLITLTVFRVLKRLLKEYEDKKEKKEGGSTSGDVNHSNMQKLKKYENMLSKKT